VSHLLRSHAPITDTAWALIDEEAKTRLTPGLAARRLVDFSGPHGWEYSATNLGRVEKIEGDGFAGVTALRRKVLPLVELRSDFSLSREELLTGDRGAEDVDLDPVALAAIQMVEAENGAVFHGSAALGIDGIVPSSTHPDIQSGDDIEHYPAAVAQAVELLLRIGIGGPYGLALGREDYTAVVETGEHGGYPLLDHLRKILGGPIVWAPGVDGAVVMSLRGGDFLFESGQDLAVGYHAHDTESVQFYLEQSFSFRVVTPEAAVRVTPVTGD
jgi:uncharacterized linocin/CFP29 family protein